MLHTYLETLNSGMSLIAELNGVDPTSLAWAPQSEVRELMELHDVYFGPTPYTGKQRTVRGAGEFLSLPVLKVIETYARRAKTQLDAWNLRVELTQLGGDVERIGKRARAMLKKKQTPPREGVKVYRRGELWTLAITAPSAVVADMHNVLRKTVAEDMVGAAKAVFFHGDGGGRAQLTTNVIVSLEQLDRIVQAADATDTDVLSEVVLQQTNGATITGAEFVRAKLAEFGFVTLVHPEEGPVNLYRTQRMGSPKQRMMASAESPVCAWPGCRLPADDCQVHHLTAWSQGGMTNSDNLTMLCRYHNGVNADAPGMGRGRMARVDGKVVWLPSWAGPPEPEQPAE